jgi:hypothetical protein
MRLGHGWESRSSVLRVLAGPSLVRAESEHAPGFSGRGDLSLPLAWRISAAASVSTPVVPSWNGDLFRYWTLGVGLRLR